MRGKKSNKRAPLFSVTHVGLILLCLVLVTGHFAGGIYAKYATENGGGDSGRVISFGELTVTEDNDLLVAPGCSIRRQTNVSFGGSEAQTYLFVKIGYDENVWQWKDGTKLQTITTYTDEHLPIAQLELASNWTKLEDALGVFYLEVPSNTVIEKQPVFANSGVVDLPAVGMSKLQGLVNTSITVDVVVVQANGFESVQDAWNAVKGGNQ